MKADVPPGAPALIDAAPDNGGCAIFNGPLSEAASPAALRLRGLPLVR